MLLAVICFRKQDTAAAGHCEFLPGSTVTAMRMDPWLCGDLLSGAQWVMEVSGSSLFCCNWALAHGQG